MTLDSSVGTSIELRPLVDCPEHAPLLAAWFYEEWGRRRPGNSVERVEEGLAQRMNRDEIPVTLVAFWGTKLVGSASLILCEMDTHPQYLHWLAGVYVSEPYRGRGLGSEIVKLAAAEAQGLGIRDLYLYTRSHEAFYARLEWKPVERSQYHGREVTIMVRKLHPQPTAAMGRSFQ